jgi:cysteine synthase B
MEEAIVPELYNPDEIDCSILIESETAFAMSREIAVKEGIFVGMSSGAAMVAALEVAKTLETGTIVVIFPDRGEKYLSTCLFEN